jgi:hypothetical protein
VKLRARIAAVCAFAALTASAASAISITQDLGHGLVYFRVHELPADLPPPPAGRPGPCVLDLRFAKSDQPSALLLSAWVKFNASATAPVFILENADTSPALTGLFSGNGSGDVIILAPASEKMSPTVSVHVAADIDRKAYDAFEKGAPIESLLSDNPAKPRLDEAYLDKEHIADTDAPDIESDKPSGPSPLVDFMVQRAVQLHRGLVALKRI